MPIAPAHPSDGSNLHWVDKLYVTTQFIQARQDSACPSGRSSCPAALGGGCCPDGYACATESCYATTAAAGTACGRTSYYACPFEAGGGCCPQGYICGNNDCTAPAESSHSQQCPIGYFACPSSLNYGCCKNGMGCAMHACYSTEPVTWVFTQTLTTTSSGQSFVRTVTSTSAITPSSPTNLPSDTQFYWAKILAPSASKVPAIETSPPGGGGGLTKPQLGGIVGGAIALLLVILIATFVIVRRLRRTEHIVEAQMRSSRGDRSSQTMTERRQHTAPSTTARTESSNEPESRQLLRGRAASETSGSTAPTPLPSGSSDMRHVSMDSAGGYFDLTSQRTSSGPATGRNSVSTGVRDSIDSSKQHGRQHSDASELSSDGNITLNSYVSPAAELDVPMGSHLPEMPGSSFSPTGSPRRPVFFAHQRRRSDGHARERKVSFGGGAGASSGSSPQPLGVVNESVERFHYFGPPHVAAGQTRVGDAQDTRGGYHYHQGST